jgi:predicted anti-sigma-YlaC factor YlaD
VKVTRDVINDLLPLYLEGEASADTRALVEAYLQGDEELARQVRAARDERSPMMSAATVTTLSPDIERRALERTRTVLRWQKWTLALAIVLTALPFTVGDIGGRTFLMMRDVPGSAWLLVPAAALWVRYLWVQRRLRGAGF